MGVFSQESRHKRRHCLVKASPARHQRFAFVTLHADEGAHPHTISSAWANDGRLTFIIKALGDHTRTLVDRVQLKDVVTVEGPYGRFNFDGKPQRQIWIGASIGITPFIARMQALAKVPDGRSVHGSCGRPLSPELFEMR